jgi:acyl-CoA hydrolase
MSKKKKFPRESFISMTELVLPNDTNTLNNLMGGRLMHWMDIVSAIAAQKHSNRIVVTASVDNISFKHPIRLGNVVTLRAKVTRAFNSSMEVRIDVDAEDIPSQQKIESNSAYFTFVAVDQMGRPIDRGRSRVLRRGVTPPSTPVDPGRPYEATRSKRITIHF